MYLLYADESGLEAKSGCFFVYGGVAVPADRAHALSGAVEKLLIKHKWPDSADPLKFSGKRPDHIDTRTHKSIKQETMRLAGEAG